MNKRALYTGGFLVVVIAIAVMAVRRGESPQIATSPTPSATLEVSVTTTPTPSVKRTPRPSSGVIAKEVRTYEQWITLLDPYNRYLELDKTCTSITPSQVEYANNTEVMIDNRTSDKARILKIGTRQYSLEPHGWIIATLQSSSLPARLPMYCGDMELGAIDLIGK